MKYLMDLPCTRKDILVTRRGVERPAFILGFCNAVYVNHEVLPVKEYYVTTGYRQNYSYDVFDDCNYEIEYPTLDVITKYEWTGYVLLTDVYQIKAIADIYQTTLFSHGNDIFIWNFINKLKRKQEKRGKDKFIVIRFIDGQPMNYYVGIKNFYSDCDFKDVTLNNIIMIKHTNANEYLLTNLKLGLSEIPFIRDNILTILEESSPILKIQTIINRLKYLITGENNLNKLKANKEETNMNLKQYVKFDIELMKRTIDGLKDKSDDYPVFNFWDMGFPNADVIEKRTSLNNYQSVNDCWNPCNLNAWVNTSTPNINYRVEEGKRYVSYGKHNGEEIPTITTIVYYNGKEGKATIDKDKYDRRQGILEALANACYDNFESKYSKIEKAEKKKERESLICPICHKQTTTKEEYDNHCKIHEEAKAKRVAKKEARKIKQEAMKRVAKLQREEAIQREVDKLMSKDNEKDK